MVEGVSTGPMLLALLESGSDSPTPIWCPGRASGRVRAGWHLSQRRHRHHAEQRNGADAQPDAGSGRIDGLSKGYAHGGDASSWNLRDRDSA
jgi:hypothetical protein